MRAHKYNAVRTEVDGISFASKKEARRYGELKLLAKAGEIEGLQTQRRFKLFSSGKPLLTETGRTYAYVADFTYFERDKAGLVAEIVEDTKGMRTDVYKLKRAIMEANGYQIRET